MSTTKENVPIVYSPAFNVRFFGLEKLHPFDSCKYEKIAAWTGESRIFVAVDRQVTEEELREVHDEKYLASLRKSFTVAQICELPPIAAFPPFMTDKYVLTPMRWQVRGTVLAGELAMKYGWAINLGGGMHHAAGSSGSGWCVYADIYLSFSNLRKNSLAKKMLIVDLDVHQGNGLARSKLSLPDPESVYILDFYNFSIFPRDQQAKKAINASWDVKRGTRDEVYLAALSEKLEEAFDKFQPDVVFYNAGTDVLQGDPLGGGVELTPLGITHRDEMVFRASLENNIPITMVLSGGYATKSASTVALSIEHLCRHVLPKVNMD